MGIEACNNHLYMLIIVLSKLSVFILWNTLKTFVLGVVMIMNRVIFFKVFNFIVHIKR